MRVEVLHQPIYSVVSAAELLRVTSRTLKRWLDGDTYRGRRYAPVIRPEPSGKTGVTWAEFVTAGLLAQFPRRLRVALSEIGAVVAGLRETYGEPYPLASFRPWEGPNRHLLLELQNGHALSSELSLVAPGSGQPLLLAPADAFLNRVDWDDGAAIAWRPHQDPGSPVRCRPAYRGGRPAIRGISTAAIAEHVAGGEPLTDVADDFDLDIGDVHWAISYEHSRRTSAAQAA